MTNMTAVPGNRSASTIIASSTVDPRGLHTIRLRGEVGSIDGPRLSAELRGHSVGASDVLIDVSRLIDLTGAGDRAVVAFCADAMARGVRVAVLTRDEAAASTAPRVAGTIVVEVRAGTEASIRI